MTLVTRPQIIFLDEPTTGLDPRNRRTMWNIVRELVADGVTVFLTTQISKKPISSPAGSRCSTRATWSPRAFRANSSARFAAATSGSQFTGAGELDAAARVLTGSTRDDEDLICGFPAMAGRNRCGLCWTDSMSIRSTLRSSPCTRRTSMTFSLP